tara:strand:+ start:1258 stop:2046 length:789 start_codon:yes stop_codon:yes gene_type:complete
MGYQGCAGSQIWDEATQSCVAPPPPDDFNLANPDPYTPPSNSTYGGGYALSGLDQYSGSGSLGGQGLQDLYSTYSEYGYLMGSAMEGFEVGGQEFGLNPYDPTQEDLVRKKYREDFRNFRSQSQNIYATAEEDRAKFAGTIGRSGFAGSGKTAMKNFQSGISGQIRDSRLGFEKTRTGALDAISGLREGYQTGATNTYMTFLGQQDPDSEIGNAATITECYSNPGMVWDHTVGASGDCVEMGTLPDEWDDTFSGYEPEYGGG